MVSMLIRVRLQINDEHITYLSLHQLPTRLARALLRFASMTQEATSWRLQVQLSQRELGNICGARRESVNKCLSTWQRRGIVHIDGGVVEIANRAALDELAELEPCQRAAPFFAGRWRSPARGVGQPNGA